MHRTVIVNDQTSLNQLNELLGEEDWFVNQISAGQDGSWLVVLSDNDPDAFGSDYEDEDEEVEYELDLDELEEA